MTGQYVTREEFETMRRSVEQLKVRGEVISLELHRLSTQSADFWEVMTERFDLVEERFRAVDARFDQMDARFDAVDERFEQMETRLGTVEQKVDLLRAELTKASNELSDGMAGITRAVADGHAAILSVLMQAR